MKNTVQTWRQAKQDGVKIAMLTAYDYSTAKLEDEAGINDDPVKRADAIRRFQEYDRTNGNSK